MKRHVIWILVTAAVAACGRIAKSRSSDAGSDVPGSRSCVLDINTVDDGCALAP
jgi:hypothetical protein